jgi:MFS family permease
LHASRSELQWVVDAYTLSFAAVMLGAGAITDALGARRAFVAGLLVFTAFSGLCAVAGSMLVLKLARLATFGPLLGAVHNLRDGFISCVIVASAASGAALLLTLAVLALSHFPSRRSVSQASSPGQGKKTAEPIQCPARPACEQ